MLVASCTYTDAGQRRIGRRNHIHYTMFMLFFYVYALLLEQERLTVYLKQRTEQILNEESILLSNFCTSYEEEHLNGISRMSLATLIMFHKTRCTVDKGL